ncbi:heme A synthase [Candidatus Zixiibacteriota bacterium]
MKKFYKFALTSTIATYILILIGGLVRVSGAGLGCPDWPTCFGRWIPPTSLSQLPPDIDPATFNILHAWTEYMNRLSGMTVGILILITTLWAIFKFRDNKKILYPSMAAAILTAFQGWQGSVVVTSQLEPIVISVHMFLALLIVGLLTYVTLEAKLSCDKSIVQNVSLPKEMLSWTKIIGIIAIAQIALGTKLRGALEVLSASLPDSSLGGWIDMTGAISYIHAGVGSFLMAFVWYLSFNYFRIKPTPSIFAYRIVYFMAGLVSIQFVLGLSFIFADITPFRQLLHLWLGSLSYGMILLLFLFLRKIERTS